ncbi:MAG: thiamine-phosphate kinase [Phycisphaerae bacterium]
MLESTLMSGDELTFVDWLHKQQRTHPAMSLGIGDDMAVVNVGNASRPGTLLVSSDMLLDGVHFDTRNQPLEKIGRKAIACGLSDCAAMAVKPVAAVVSVALPKVPGGPSALEDAKRLLEGMFAIADEYDLALVGGDTTSWEHPLAIDAAVTATPYEGIEPVRRDGAKRGDKLFVTGPLGGSLLGRHLEFTPRVHEAKALAEVLGTRLHAMMDVSDGLALDLWRMCQASGVGAVLSEQLLDRVISQDANRAAETGPTPSRTALDHALGDGEDFELLLAVSGDATDAPAPLFPIGEITDHGLTLNRTDGRSEPLQPTGYTH